MTKKTPTLTIDVSNDSYRKQNITGNVNIFTAEKNWYRPKTFEKILSFKVVYNEYYSDGRIMGYQKTKLQQEFKNLINSGDPIIGKAVVDNIRELINYHGIDNIVMKVSHDYIFESLDNNMTNLEFVELVIEKLGEAGHDDLVKEGKAKLFELFDKKLSRENERIGELQTIIDEFDEQEELERLMAEYKKAVKDKINTIVENRIEKMRTHKAEVLYVENKMKSYV